MWLYCFSGRQGDVRIKLDSSFKLFVCQYDMYTSSLFMKLLVQFVLTAFFILGKNNSEMSLTKTICSTNVCYEIKWGCEQIHDQLFV